MIAVFSHRRATEADRVIRRLRAEGCSPVRINTGHAEAAVSIEVGRSVPIRATAVCDGRPVNAAEIRFAWMHQPPPAGPSRLRETPGGVAAESSRLRLWEAYLSCVPDRRWLTSPASLSRASNKLLQYRCAGEAGLAVPESLGSNDPSEIRSYAGTPSVMKYLGDTSRLWGFGSDGFAAVTTTADVERVDDEALLASPTLFQRIVETSYEVRAVAVRGSSGFAVFAAAGTKPPGVLDIRLAPDAMTRFQPYSLPADVEARLNAAMAGLEVGFCSADLLRDTEGQYWFVDLNATGAWWWIDDLYDREITRMIAETLRRELHA
jgi:hypothetical protein